MSYQVLARKWRPREFSSLIGQQAVVTALTNALRDGKIAQAYLFSGIRGVGKTTAARLFAKALNCESAPEKRPCNECPTCLEITAGADLDVLEIDAATYSKVEQVRELAESLKYGPTRDRYKVVVLDEVHRLSRQAFDALLKIVEEPPPRLVFIFATTEADAVPATILSRCQEFHFRRVGASEVAAHLAEIAAAEQIRASDRALRLIARAGEGSVRDSVALLDQLATFGSGEVREEDAARLVGGLDLALFGQLLAAIVAGDAQTVAALARQVEEQGWDPRQVHAHFLGYVRDALHIALGGERAAVELPPEEAASLANLARETGYENLLRLLHHLLASESTVRRSDAAQLALELAWLRAAELPKLIGVEELLAGNTPAGAANISGDARAAVAAASASSAAARPAPSAPTRNTPSASARAASSAPARSVPPEASAPPAPSPARVEPPRVARTEEPEAPAPQPPRAAVAPETLTPAGRVERFREELSARRPTLAAQLTAAAVALEDGRVTIELADDDPVAAAQLGRNSNREMIDAAIRAAFGADVTWRFLEAAKKSRAAGPAAARSEARGASRIEAEATPAPVAVASDPRVQAVLDIFGGGVRAAAGRGAKPEVSEPAEPPEPAEPGAEIQEESE